MLRIIQLEALERKLAEASHLVECYREGGSSFDNDVEKWSRSIEAELQNNRLPAASVVAGLRSTIISVQEGALPPNLEIAGRSTRRKRRRAMAAETLRRIVEVVQDAIQGDRARIDEAERIAAHILAIARANGIVAVERPSHKWNTDDVHQLIQALKSNSATVQGAVHLEGLTGPADAVIVLDRVLGY